MELLIEKKDGITTITLNAPDKMNALTMKMKRNLPITEYFIVPHVMGLALPIK